MHRFYVPPHAISPRGEAVIPGEAARQIARVLRLKPGDTVAVFDGSGHEYVVRLNTLGRNEARGEVIERREGQADPAARVTLYLALLNKPEKLEWALQKCTEVGAWSFVPMLSARTVVGLPNSSRYERWARIIQEAAEQSGRTLVPTLEPALPFGEAVLRAASGLAVIPTLGATVPFARALQPAAGLPAAKVSLFVGPEGGFAPEEVTAAEAGGIVPVTLGPRTLRAETAAVVGLSIALNALGDME